MHAHPGNPAHLPHPVHPQRTRRTQHTRRTWRTLRTSAPGAPSAPIAPGAPGPPSAPWRTRAQRSLKNCLEFKGGHAPPANVPMLLLPLQCDVKDLVRTWLRELLQHHSCLFPWFHVPTTHVVLRRNRPFSDFVFNFHSFLQSWSDWTNKYASKIRARHFAKSASACMQQKHHVWFGNSK